MNSLEIVSAAHARREHSRLGRISSAWATSTPSTAPTSRATSTRRATAAETPVLDEQ